METIFTLLIAFAGLVLSLVSLWLQARLKLRIVPKIGFYATDKGRFHTFAVTRNEIPKTRGNLYRLIGDSRKWTLHIFIANISAFPITITETGLSQERFHGPFRLIYRVLDKFYDFNHSRHALLTPAFLDEEPGPWPRRLESRTSVQPYFETNTKDFLALKAGKIYVTTACGETRYCDVRPLIKALKDIPPDPPADTDGEMKDASQIEKDFNKMTKQEKRDLYEKFKKELIEKYT